MTKVKICGLKATQDIEFVNELLPDFVGFVFVKSKRQIGFQEAKCFKSFLDSSIQAVGVFVNAAIGDICALEGIIDIVQLHGDEDEDYVQKLKANCKMPIIKAFRVGESFQMQNTSADFLLFDTASKDAYGGTGEVFDWNKINNLSNNLTQRPVFLAGGINAENVGRAIETVKPFCVDVSSSVETDGCKDFEKMKKLIDIVRGNTHE